MLKRSAGATALVGAALLLLVFAAGAGAGNNNEPFGDGSVVQTYATPLGLSKGPATVVLQVAGKPWAQVQGEAGHKLSKAEKDQIKASLRATQAPIEAKVRELGGTVQNAFQSAYNGIRISIGRDKLATLAKTPNVIGIHALQTFTPDNVRGVPLVGGPAVWDGVNGLHGEGVKVGIIDTGIDYTHADFGGPGTPADYATAHANEAQPANPLLFGPGAPRVKGGTDLVGDAYSGGASVPQPDPNPLDCNGHGSHVAGTAAGSGVLSNGTTYNGLYNANTISGNSWTVGPGVAPKADIYAIRVFGCTGSTNVVVDAIDWAVDNDMDVINMSLGSPFGTADDPSAVASTNAADAGVIVVASAGNSGQNPYITGSPSTGDGAISVAANDPTQSFPGVNLALSTGQSITAINANGAAVSDGTTLPVKVLRNADGSVSLGCNPAEYTAAGVTGDLAITTRGVCARVARAIFGQQAGAAAVGMINNTAAYPPFEGQITNNPDTGEQYTVTIPFLGFRGVDGSKIAAADGGTATMTNTTVANPAYLALADFTSGGPRNGDSALKPEITAPGVSIVSVGMGTGNGAATLSGTSMAAPHTSGVAALVRQAHPGWAKVSDLKAAIVDTADPAGVANYSTRVAGAGLVQALPATRTDVNALGPKQSASLSFGFADTKGNYSKTLTMTLKNHGGSAATFSLADSNAGGVPHSLSFSASSVTVPAGGTASVGVTLNVPVGSIGATPGLHDAAGLVKLTPTAGNNGVTLRLPYYLVARADSNLGAKLGAKSVPAGSPSTTAKLTNAGGAISEDADFYAWGLSDPSDSSGAEDVRGIGVQSFQDNADNTRRQLVFAVNGYHRWSTASTQEFDIYVDVDNDGTDDYVVVGVDRDRILTGSFTGRVVGSFVFSLSTGAGTIVFNASAPSDGTTELLPIRSTQLCLAGDKCLSAANPRFTYHAFGFDITSDAFDAVTGTAEFNAWSPAISQGDFVPVAPGATVNEPVTIDPAEWAQTPALGAMIVGTNNKAGADEAQLLPLTLG